MLAIIVNSYVRSANATADLIYFLGNNLIKKYHLIMHPTTTALTPSVCPVNGGVWLPRVVAYIPSVLGINRTKTQPIAVYR